MVRCEAFHFGCVCFRYVGRVMVGPLICHFSTDEEEEENTEDQDEQGNLRGLIDDGEEVEEEEAPKSGSGAGSDSEEEVRHRRKKRSKSIGCF